MNTPLYLKRFGHLIAAAFVLFALVATPGTMAAASAQGQSYIVEAQSAAAAAALVARYGGTVTSELDVINGVGATLAPEAAAALRAQPAITAVTANAEVRMVGDGGDGQEEGGLDSKSPATDYPDVVGANVAWAKGVNGSGVTVAVVDTGVAKHRGIVRGIDGKFTNRLVAWQDFVDGRPQPFDPNGHGTHITGVIANSQVGADKEWNGVAPGVKLVEVRVLDQTGAGTYEHVIQGIQWVIKHKAEYNIRILNLSLVSTVQSPYWADPLDQAVMRAWASGLVVVAAAGNGGPAPMTVGVPANTPYVVTVGAFTDNFTPSNWNDDYIAPFSSAGPTLDGFTKPDVMAPGAHIVSTMLPNTYIAKNHEADRVANQYFSMAGTSQAAAVTTGVAALILSRNPGLSPDQVKYRLMQTAFPWVDPATTRAGYSIWQQGAGRINAPDAVFAQVKGSANGGLDIRADLSGAKHFEGYSYYDAASGTFRLRGDFASWDGGYGAWSGGYGAWSGGYGAWSGGYGAWSGGYGAWSGGYGAWSGGYGAWSGGYGAWSGGYGAWSGGYGAWSGGYGAWSGSVPWAGSVFATPAFVQSFLAGVSPSAAAATTFLPKWVEEPTK